jgi:serine protease AprX
MAAPVVSGAAALMIQADPTLTPDTVKARLMKSAAKTFPQYSSWTDPATGVTYTSQYDAFTVGAGYVDVAAALAATDVVPAGMNAKSPSVTYDPNTGNTYLVTGSSVIWGSSVVWGSSVIWGSSVNTDALSGQSIVWGSSVVWGSSTSDAFSVIWGSSVLWGASNDAAQTADAVAGDN